MDRGDPFENDWVELLKTDNDWTFWWDGDEDECKKMEDEVWFILEQCLQRLLDSESLDLCGKYATVFNFWSKMKTI